MVLALSIILADMVLSHTHHVFAFFSTHNIVYWDHVGIT